MNYRHPNQNEREVLAQYCESIGAVEVLRVISAKIAHDHPDIFKAAHYRSVINGAARELAQDDTHLIQAGNRPYEAERE